MNGASSPLTKEQEKRLEAGLHVKAYSARVSIAGDAETATMTIYNIEEPVVISLPLPEFAEFVQQACRALQQRGERRASFPETTSERS